MWRRVAARFLANQLVALPRIEIHSHNKQSPSTIVHLRGQSVFYLASCSLWIPFKFWLELKATCRSP